MPRSPRLHGPRVVAWGALLGLVGACDGRAPEDAGARLDAGGGPGAERPRDGGTDDGGRGGDAGDGGAPDAGLVDGGIDAGGPTGADAGFAACDPFAGAQIVDVALAIAGGAASASGRHCPREIRRFSFEGTVDEGVQVVVRSDVPAGYATALYSPASSTVAILETAGYAERIELGSSVLYGSGAQELRLFAYREEDIPDEGFPFRLDLRLGPTCRADEDCGASSSAGGPACRPALWTPTAGADDVVPLHVRFADGVCALPLAACDGDDEGPSRSQAAPLPALAQGCSLDEDWYSHEMVAAGDAAFVLQNAGASSGDWLVTVHDALGNTLGGRGLRDVPPGASRAFVVPKLAAGRVLLVRVLQLHDAQGAHALAVTEQAASCVVDEDCAAPETAGFGRTRCAGSACECPTSPLDPGRCGPS